MGMGLRFSSFMQARGNINYCKEFWNYAGKILNELDECEVVLTRLIKQNTR
jgi:hypothetical protein